MSVNQADKAEVQALKVYKELGIQLKDLQAAASAVGIQKKIAAVTKLTEDEISLIRQHLGIPEPVAATPAEAAAQKAADEAEQRARAEKEETDRVRREKEEAEAKHHAEAAARETERIESARLADAAAKQAVQNTIATALNIRPEQIEPIAKTFGVPITKPEEVDDALKARVEAMRPPLKLADDLKIDLKELADLGRSIGIEIGRKGFRGLSSNEEIMLRAMAKQKYRTAQQRIAEVTVEKSDYQPAPPTGNKATAVIPKQRETGQTTAGSGSGASAPRRREILPQNAPAAPLEDDWGREVGRPGQKGTAGGVKTPPGRSGRKRFDITEIGYDRPRAGGKRRAGKRDGEEEEQPQKIEVPTGPVTVEMPANLRVLSEAMGVKANEIMARMLAEGLPVIRINETLSKDLIEQIGIIFEREITVTEPKGAEELIQEQLEVFKEDQGEEVTRSPVVTIMGHVDHGKTSLLDAIASMDRAAGESGGITQHIGAFRIDLVQGENGFEALPPGVTEAPTGKKGIHVTFIDTPGHEAFTAMRARGANVTDIAVIVVSADDGVMPQTEEAIAHARAAKVEIVVAITKVDKVEANLQKVRQQLAKFELMSPEWGGNTEIVECSSVTKQGIDKLLQVLSDMAELLELKSPVDRPAVGTVLEAHRDIGRGIVASVVVQQGTLRKGDVIVAGHGYGRVRALQISRGSGLVQVDIAGPSMPVEVAGLDEMPEAGSRFHGMKDIKKAAEIAQMVQQQEKELERSRGFSLEEWSKAKAGQAVKELVLVLKCDMQGSAETIRKELEKLTHDEVRVKVIHSAVGQISTTDIHLAEAAQGIVLGFHVGVDPLARELAENHHVDVRTYEIIYRLIDDVRSALSGMLAPEIVETYQGTAEIRQVFKLSRVGTVAGCMVTRGEFKRDSHVRLQRQGINIWTGKLASLKRGKDDASTVGEGYECGMQLAGYDDIKEGDTIESFVLTEHARSL
ncbi:MAG: translation initiation factor IF-2 [Planctomycetes bacterium]|nr:translation initiation factor IF-2 [Planctomycetota bacterium]